MCSPDGFTKGAEKLSCNIHIGIKTRYDENQREQPERKEQCVTVSLSVPLLFAIFQMALVSH